MQTRTAVILCCAIVQRWGAFRDACALGQAWAERASQGICRRASSTSTTSLVTQTSTTLRQMITKERLHTCEHVQLQRYVSVAHCPSPRTHHVISPAPRSIVLVGSRAAIDVAVAVSRQIRRMLPSPSRLPKRCICPLCLLSCMVGAIGLSSFHTPDMFRRRLSMHVQYHC